MECANYSNFEKLSLQYLREFEDVAGAVEDDQIAVNVPSANVARLQETRRVERLLEKYVLDFAVFLKTASFARF